MKYSREQQKQHFEIVVGILSEDNTLSTRTIWRRLRDKGVFLDRGYVTKLAGQARVEWANEEQNLRLKKEEVAVWEQEANEILSSFYKTMSVHLTDHPWGQLRQTWKKELR